MTNTDSIRKAAILISLLDTHSADALLDSMGEELAAKVRQAVMDLFDVSPQEQEQVLSDFLCRPAQNDFYDGGVELAVSSDGLDHHLPETRQPPAEVSCSAGAPSLRFLEDIAPAIVADALLHEQPQTVAVVVAHLTPEHAGQVLERLPPSLATEALSRMAWLNPPAPEVLADLESALRRRLAPFGGTTRGGQPGVASVKAILASLSDARRTELIDRLARQDERLARRLESAAEPRFQTQEEHNQVVSFRYRLDDSHYRTSSPPGSQSAAPLVEFEDLTLLSDRDLGRIAAAADPQTLALALIEADERLSRRLLRGLPSADAAAIRQRLAQPGPMRLKDIDHAQRQLADLARHLASRGQISLPHSRHFAAAA